MLKKIFILFLMFALLSLAVPVSAEVTNLDMQLMGGVLVSSSVESFFFAPMEPGVPSHWGLYALSSCGNGPILETTRVPARLVHADQAAVYFFMYTDDSRTVQSLFTVSASGGQPEELLPDIACAFPEANAKFFYVTASDPYTLRRYDIVEKKATELKDMSASSKKIIDAFATGGETYFVAADANNTQFAYKINKSSGKATSLEDPNPKAALNLLFGKYRVYSSDGTGTRVYAVPIEGKKGVPIGGDGKYAVSLNNPRFGNYIYTYDGDAHRIVGCPLDGSGEVSVALDGDTMSNLIMGGSPDEILFYNYGGIYSTTSSLGTATKLFDFDTTLGGQVWNYIVPAGSGHVVVMGYNAETMTHAASMPPTGVYVFTRSGEMVFGYPDATATPAPIASGEVTTTMPEQIGDVPNVPLDEEEEDTYFVF